MIHNTQCSKMPFYNPQLQIAFPGRKTTLLSMVYLLNIKSDQCEIDKMVTLTIRSHSFKPSLFMVLVLHTYKLLRMLIAQRRYFPWCHKMILLPSDCDRNEIWGVVYICGVLLESTGTLSHTIKWFRASKVSFGKLFHMVKYRKIMVTLYCAIIAKLRPRLQIALCLVARHRKP